MEVYAGLNLPPYSPPGSVFPIVWSILYILMGISLYLVRESNGSAEDKKKGYWLFGIQLVFNFLWTLVFFVFRFYTFAAVWLAALLILTAVNIYYFALVNKTSAWLLVPYIIWLAFALYLNTGVAMLN